MEYSKTIDHTMDRFEQLAAKVVHDSIQNASNGTERSQQQAEFRLGMSNIGHCRQAAVLMIRQTPPSDVRDKSAAFFGTVAGAAIEAQMKKDHPGWLFQSEAFFEFLSGGGVGCHPDIAIPAREGVTPEEFEAQFEPGYDGPELFVQGVWDLKSKDKLDFIKKYGPSTQQKYQVAGYAKALTEKLLLIDPATGEITADEEIGVPVTDENGEPTGETVLDPTKPIWISDVYFDRSGAQKDPYTFGWWYDPAILQEIDDWIHDVKYAAINGEDASRDKSRDWCWAYCEFATTCRGNDTDVEGLIEDDEILTALHLYDQAAQKERAAKKEKENVKLSIPAQLSGSTGTHNVRWLEVAETENRKAHRKLLMTPVPGPKKPKKVEAN